MAPKTRNLNFNKESYERISWTQVSQKSWLVGRDANCCGDRIQPGQIVITVPLVRDEVVLATAAIHRSCLDFFLNDVPDDNLIVLEQVEKIRARFRREDK